MNRRSKRDRSKNASISISRILIFEFSRTFVIDWELLKAHKNELPQVDWQLQIILGHNFNAHTHTNIHTQMNVQEGSQRHLHSHSFRTRFRDEFRKMKENGIIPNFESNRSRAFYYLHHEWSIAEWFIMHMLRIFRKCASFHSIPLCTHLLHRHFQSV